MRKILFPLVAAVLSILPLASANAIQCVAYAREVSGVRLQGDAWQWWDAAQGVYSRGGAPRQGAILVFSRQGSMRHGHVSVVARVVSARLVLVDHANWAPARGEGRGQVAHAVPVMDVSPNNDWSQVRVWYRPAGLYGNRVYQTQGFVYGGHAVSDDGPQPIEEAALAQVDRTPLAHGRTHAAGRAQRHPTSAGLVKIADPAFRPRPRPADGAEIGASAGRRSSGG